MIIDIGKIRFELPGTYEDLPLSERIGFDEIYGDDIYKIEQSITSNKKLTDDAKKVKLFECMVDRMQKACAYFGGVELEEVRTISIKWLNEFYHSCVKGYIEIYKYEDPRFVPFSNSICQPYWHIKHFIPDVF